MNITDSDMNQIELIKYRMLTPGGWFYHNGGKRKRLSWELAPEQQGNNKAYEKKFVLLNETNY